MSENESDRAWGHTLVGGQELWEPRGGTWEGGWPRAGGQPTLWEGRPGSGDGVEGLWARPHRCPMPFLRPGPLLPLYPTPTMGSPFPLLSLPPPLYPMVYPMEHPLSADIAMATRADEDGDT